MRMHICDFEEPGIIELSKNWEKWHKDYRRLELINLIANKK